MAMEVSRSKRLHHRSLAVLLAVFSLLLLTVAAARPDLSRALTARTFDVKPAANGLGDISAHDERALPSLGDAGQAANFSFSFDGNQ